MSTYMVIKTINGRQYRYRQTTWRESGRMRTKNEYVGPVAAATTGTAHDTAGVGVRVTGADELDRR